MRWRLTFLSVILLSLASFAYFNPFAKSLPYKLSTIAIFQNEDRFLKEWIDFHLALGVDHFYLYNNLSKDNYRQVLQPYVDRGIVDLYDWPYASKDQNNWTKIQSAAYREGIKLAKETSEWVAIIDTDEFLFPMKEESIPAFLKSYEDASGIFVNWLIYGTSHVPKLADCSLMIETLDHRAPQNEEMNTYCKSIFRPSRVLNCIDPHHVIFYPWYYAVDPDRRIMHWEFHKRHPVLVDKIRINHYWSRDEEFFISQKLSRYAHWGAAREACIERNRIANRRM